jgi:hypothetical protein
MRFIPPVNDLKAEVIQSNKPSNPLSIFPFFLRGALADEAESASRGLNTNCVYGSEHIIKQAEICGHLTDAFWACILRIQNGMRCSRSGSDDNCDCCQQDTQTVFGLILADSHFCFPFEI